MFNFDPSKEKLSHDTRLKQLCTHAKSLQSCLTLCDPVVACEAPLAMGFSRQEYWSGLPCPPPGDLSDPGIKPGYPTLVGRFFTTEQPGRSIPSPKNIQLGNSVYILNN